VELVLDCAEPRRLAKFWREALDHQDYYTDENLLSQPSARTCQRSSTLEFTEG
jgi:hypothetical protein